MIKTVNIYKDNKIIENIPEYAKKNNLNSSNIYGSRMRGKYLICNIIDYKPRTDVALQYIITKFRTSWT